jgi:GGDEF domain-containing protein/tetratricopeptide (TPR) repeat protein
MADISKRLEKAEKYLQKGKVEPALEEYLSILDAEPGNDSARHTAADLFLQLNRGQEAASLLSELFDRQIALGDNAKAALTYKKLARLVPPNLGQSLRFAQVSERSGNRREALEAYETTAKGFLEAKRNNEALAAIRRITLLEPSIANLKRQGELAAKLKDGKTAGESFLKIGIMEEEDGQIAFSSYERAYKFDSANPEIALRYGAGLLDKGEALHAVEVLEPGARGESSQPDHREAYGMALLAAHRPKEAYPILWELFQRNPGKLNEIGKLIRELIDLQFYAEALELSRKLETIEERGGRQREFVAFLRDIIIEHPPDADFLEYLAKLFNSANREHDYCDTLVRLFQLRYAAGDFRRAADSLDKAAEVDPYIEGLEQRLELLRGKIDPGRYRTIENRFQNANAEPPDNEEKVVPEPQLEPESTVLEDLILQAEIFLQYSMRSKALERIERIQKLFPREEARNEKLRLLYVNAGIVPHYADDDPATAAATGGQRKGAASSTRASEENSVENFTRVTEITRNIFRQSNVKSVLFAAVNDVGRHWSASRCVAGLCSPGKPPSAALEYCAPGIKQSDVMAIVRLIGTLQHLAMQRGSVVIENAKNAPELGAIQQHVNSLELQSVMAVPLVDGDEHVGILILEQCDHPRKWGPKDVVVSKTIADQMVLAVHNTKLRNLMKTLAVTDEKSGLLKRASYLDVMLSEVKRATQQNSQSTLMLLNFGKASALTREAGEAGIEGLMQSIGQTICSHIRQTDTAIRYDKTTIALVLGDTNDKNAFFVVEKFRKALATTHVPGSERLINMAAGIAGIVMQAQYDPVDIVTEAINRAEHALEMAVSQGPNSAHALAPIGESAAVA